MDLERIIRETKAGGQGSALDDLARSEAGARLAAKLDGKKLEQAARNGDMQALGRMLQGLLATPEGKDFAERVQRAVQGHGQ